MKDFASNLLGTPPAGKSDIDFSSKLLGTAGRDDQGPEYVENPYQKETGAISAITGKAMTEGSEPPQGYRPADMRTLLKAGFVDNDQSKIKLFADARGISPDRYEIKGGQVWFKGDDGKMYPEVPKEVGNLIKKLVAEIPSESLPDAGAAAGAAVGGVPGAIAGAGSGELLRKKIGEAFFGDDQTKMDYAADIALNALLAGADSKLAKSAVSGMSARKIQKATGGRVSRDFTHVVGDLSPAQRADGAVISDTARGMGIDLKPHQAMDDPTLTAYYKLLRDNPKTARAVAIDDKKLDQQVFDAGEDLIRSISNRETDPFTVGENLSKLGTDTISKMKSVRTDAVSGLYEKASQVSGVDVTPAVEKIDDLLGKVAPGMKAKTAIQRVRRMLVGKDGAMESRLEVLDGVKKEIDAVLSGKDGNAITAKIKKDMQDIKDILTTQTDAVSREYKVGRALYSAASPKITEAENSILGTLSRIKTGEGKESAVKMVFKSPQSIRMAKRAAEKADPELWKDTVAEFFREEFESAAKSAQSGKVINRPGKYYKGMWDLSSRRKLQIATDGMMDGNGDPLFGRIQDFFNVMEKAAIGHGKESATQSRLMMEKGLRGMPEQAKEALGNLRQSTLSLFLGNAGDRAFDRNAKKLLELMQTPEGVDLIAKAKGYGPKTEKGMTALATLLLMSSESVGPKVPEIIRTGLQDEQGQGQ